MEDNQELEEAKVDLSNIPLSQRVENKDWKYRSSAVDEIKNRLLNNNFDEDTIIYIESILPKLTSDSNASVLESAFEIAIQFFDTKFDVVKQDTLEKVLSNILDKGISARPSTQAKCKSLLFMMVEISEPKWLVLSMLPKLLDKKPKIPPFILEFFVESISTFGANFFPIKEILAALPPLFNTTNNLTRDAAMNLLVEIFKWVGDGPLLNILENLRPAQKTDFEKIKSELPNIRPIPNRKIRKFPDLAIESNVASNTINTKDLIDEVDLNKKLKGSDYIDLMKSEKWSEQFQGLETIEKAIGPTPKIKDAPIVHDLIQMIHELLKNGHLQVQLKCLKVLSMFSEGLGSKISADIRNLMVTIISKLKEKKLVQDVETCYKSFILNTLSFDSLSDDIIENLRNKKSPSHSKICLNQVFAFYLESKKVINNFDLFKMFFDTMIINCDDSDPKVRESSVTSLNILFSKYGDDSNLKKLFASLNTSNSKLFKRITTNPSAKSEEPFHDTLKVSEPIPRAPKTKESSIISKTSSTLDPPSKPTKHIEDNKSFKKQSAKNKDDENQDISEDIIISPEDLTQILQVIDLVEGNPIHQLLVSAKWQEKVDGLNKVKEKVFTLKVGGIVFHALFLYLKQLTTNFKINNVNVTKAVVEVFISCAENAGESSLNKSAIVALIALLSEKISDKKLQNVIETLIKQFCLLGETSLVFKKVISVIEPSKSPIVHQLFLQWMKSFIDEFKLSGVPVSIVSSFAVREIENKNVSVRNASIELIGSIYNKLGPPLLSLIFTKDLSPHSKTLIETEINKVGFDSKAVNTIKFDSEDALPRKDILDLVDKNIYSNLSCVDGKDSWQIRKAALENILTGCESCGHYLEYNKSFLDISKAVKMRLNDTQSNLKPLAINVLGNLFSSLPNEKAVKALKLFGSSILQGLSDNKKPMRDATISALDKIITLNSEKVDNSMFMCIVLFSSEILENVNARAETISWFLSHQENFEGECSELSSHFISVLQDKNAIVRNNTEQLLIYLFSNHHISKISLEKAIRDLSPAVKRSLQLSIDKILACNISKDHHDRQNIKIDFQSSEKNETVINAINMKTLSVQDDLSLKSVSDILFDNISPKKQRLSEWSNWPKPPMEPSIYDLSVLKSQWKNFMSDSFFEEFFSENQESLVNSLNKIKTLFHTSTPLLHSDYILRYLSFLLLSPQNQKLFPILLKFLDDFFNYIVKYVNQSDVLFEIGELNLFLPHLIKIFPNFIPQNISTFQQILENIYSLIPMNKVSNFLMMGILTNSQLSSKIFFLQEILKVLESVGFGALARADLNEFIKFLYLNHDTIKETGILSQFSKTLTNLIDRDFTKLNSFFEAENIEKVFYLLGRLKPHVSQSEPNDLSKMDLNSVFVGEINFINEFMADPLIKFNSTIAHKLRTVFDIFSLMEWPIEILKLLYQMVTKIVDTLNSTNIYIGSSINYTCCTLAISILVHIFSLPNAKTLMSIQSQTNLLKSLLIFLQNIQSSNSNSAYERLITRSFNLLLHDFINLYEPGETILILLEALFQIDNSCNRIPIRLILTLINNESKKINPFSNPSWNLPKIFLSFDAYINSGCHDEYILRLIKTVTQSILRGLGYHKVIEILNSINIADQSFIYSIVALLNDNISNNSNLEAKIVTAINDITFARDKLNSIKELYKLKQQYSELDLNLYLKKLSPVFRRFVFDILAKIDDKEKSKEKDQFPPNSVIEPTSNPHEAILLIESLKAKPPQYRTSMKLDKDFTLESEEPDSFDDKKLYGSPRSVPISPFTRRNEKIRDSLSSLTKSLQLPTLNDDTKTNDSLENRLQRLKSLQNMSNLDI